MSSKVVALGAVLVALAAAVWWSTRSKTSEPVAEETSNASPAWAPDAALTPAAPSEGAASEGFGGAATVGVSDERVASTDGLDAELLVRVIGGLDGAPVEGVAVYPDSNSVPTEQFWRYFGQGPGRTDEHGEVVLRIPANARLELQVRAGLVWNPTVLAVESALPGSRTTLDVVLESAMRSRYFVRVISAETGAPIPEARAQTDDAPEARADARGIIALGAEKRGASARVEADGYRSEQVSLEGPDASPADAQVVMLIRGAAVRAAVLQRGVPASGLEVRVQSHTTSSRASTGTDGTCLVAGLPVAESLHWALLRARRVIATGRVEPLAEGETRDLEIRCGDGKLVRGRVLGPEDEPVRDCSVMLASEQDLARDMKESEDVWTYVELAEWERGRCLTTDADGSFAFEDVGAGTWLVCTGESHFLGPPGPDRGRLAARMGYGNALDAWSGDALHVRVSDAEPPAEITLRMHRGIAIRGIVVQPDGNGVGDVWVAGWPAASEGFARQSLETRCVSADDGSFALGPLRPGSYELFAGTDIGTLATAEADAGASGVRMVLAGYGRIDGRVVDPRGELEYFSVRIAALGAGTDGRLRCFEFESDETGQFDRAIAPGQYDLVAHSTDGRVALHEDVNVTADVTTGSIELELQDGAWLEISCPADRAFADCTVMRGDVALWTDRVVRGVREVVAVPAGSITVRIFAEDEVVAAETVEAKSGETAKVEFDVE